MDLILIAIVIVCLYLAITIVGFSKVSAALSTPFDTRFVRPVKFINNPNLAYEIDVEPPETSLTMMRGTDIDNPGADDIQIGDLIKVSTKTYEPMLCGKETHAVDIEYFGRVVGVDGEKAKIQWTYYKVVDGNECTEPVVNGCRKSDNECCAGKEYCHFSKADENNKGEIRSLFGTSEMPCNDCPVTSRVSLDRLTKVNEIPTPGYVSENWLRNVAPEGNKLMSTDNELDSSFSIF